MAVSRQQDAETQGGPGPWHVHRASHVVQARLELRVRRALLMGRLMWRTCSWCQATSEYGPCWRTKAAAAPSSAATLSSWPSAV